MTLTGKTPDPPSGARQCYSVGQAGTLPGITFELKSGRRRFGPYSFLCAVDLNGGEELIFHYTFGTITVEGENLDFLWANIENNSLSKLIEVDCEKGLTVKSITIEDSSAQT